MRSVLGNRDHKTIRSLQKDLAKANEKYSLELMPVPKSEWPPIRFEPFPVEVLRSKKFIVQIYEESKNLIRLTIHRTQIDHTGRWADGITWDELQWIKNQAGFAHHDAVEVYPAAEDVVNDSNMRHLWVFRKGKLNFVWRKPE